MKTKCPYCDDSGVLVRHNHLHGTIFIKCPYCERKNGVTPVQLLAIIAFTLLIAWGIAVALTMMFS